VTLRGVPCHDCVGFVSVGDVAVGFHVPPCTVELDVAAVREVVES
jgi:hypothetical protein